MVKALVKRKIGRVYTYNGLNRVETDEAEMGDIIAFAGIDDINIGETVADAENPEALPSTPSTNQHCPWYSP